MAIEDAAALGILFRPDYFDGNVAEALQAYQEIRLPRVTKVQAASAKAAVNINERIGRHLRFTGEVDANVDRFLEQHQYSKVQGRQREGQADDRGDEWVSRDW
jgi:2-polyprenyl-6-methoxyphenol hydroxylase-like FAD-dependent oxidoreductase